MEQAVTPGERPGLRALPRRFANYGRGSASGLGLAPAERATGQGSAPAVPAGGLPARCRLTTCPTTQEEYWKRPNLNVYLGEGSVSKLAPLPLVTAQSRDTSFSERVAEP